MTRLTGYLRFDQPLELSTELKGWGQVSKTRDFLYPQSFGVKPEIVLEEGKRLANLSDGAVLGKLQVLDGLEAQGEWTLMPTPNGWEWESTPVTEVELE